MYVSSPVRVYTLLYIVYFIGKVLLITALFVNVYWSLHKKFYTL